MWESVHWKITNYYREESEGWTPLRSKDRERPYPIKGTIVAVTVCRPLELPTGLLLARSTDDGTYTQMVSSFDC